MSDGTSAESLHSAAARACQRVPQRGVDRRRRGRVVVRLDLDRVGEVTERFAQQRGASSPDWPGQRADVDLELDLSGMTLVFVPPCATVGANVVCVHACQCRAMPIGSSASAPAEVVRVEQRGGELGIECMPSTNWRHDSWICVCGLVLGDAAHDLGRGDERVVGAERLRAVARRAAAPVIFVQNVPFSPTSTGRRGARGRRHLEPARLGEHVVGVDRVALVVEQPVARPTCPSASSSATAR